MKKGLNANQIKYIVIIAMLVDHIAWLFVPLYSFAGQAMHFVGRLTGPTMAVLLADGYRYTKDIHRYTLRLAVFALISWPCYCLMDYGQIKLEFGVIYTLFLALLAIRLYDSSVHYALKLLGLCLLFFLSGYGDWAYYDIAFALIAHVWHDDKKTRWMAHTFVCVFDLILITQMIVASGHAWYYALFECGTFMVVPMFVFFYNGERGSGKAFHKWFFYVFYPLHMLLLWIMKYRPF